MTVELACDNAVFHFNKKHLTDPTIPMWIVKAKGESYYVEHVTCEVPWSTKETPGNEHTKGSIKIKKCLITIDDQNHAIISSLNNIDVERLKKKNEKPIRIWFESGFKDVVSEFEHTDLQLFHGSCGERYYVCDLLHEKDLTYLTLTHMHKFRVLMENENYYTEYEQKNGSLAAKMKTLFKMRGRVR